MSLLTDPRVLVNERNTHRFPATRRDGSRELLRSRGWGENDGSLWGKTNDAS